MSQGIQQTVVGLNCVYLVGNLDSLYLQQLPVFGSMPLCGHC